MDSLLFIDLCIDCKIKISAIHAIQCLNQNGADRRNDIVSTGQGGASKASRKFSVSLAFDGKLKNA